MRPAPPLAVLLLLPSLASAGLPKPCPAPVFEGKEAFLLEDAEVCRTFLAAVPDFERLRAAAGFAPGQLGIVLENHSADNAYYYRHAKTVVMLMGSLWHRKPEAVRMVLAHEIGHAVQDREGIMAWKNEPYYNGLGTGFNTWEEFEKSAAFPEYLRRSRQFEAQADGIAVELMARAGLNLEDPADRVAARYGCGTPHPDAESTHPVGPQRVYNAAWSHVALPAELVSSKRGRIEAMIKQADFGDKKDIPVAAGFRPVTGIRDYDDLGRFKPGRLTMSRFRVPAAPPTAGKLREHAQFIAGSVVDYWFVEPAAQALDALAYSPGTVDLVMSACGVPEGEGPAFWARRTTMWLASKLRT